MEITYLLLEATSVHLYFSRGPAEQLSKPPGGLLEGGNMKPEYGGGGGGKPMPNLSQAARMVYQVLKSEPQNNEGLHMQNIAAKLGLSIPAVIKAGNELLDHSMIFTTVDDFTWALLDL